MKRIFVSLCVVMMILLAGCGQTADSVSETISQASDLNKAGYIIGVPEGTPPEEVAKEFMPNADISYFTQFMDGVAALKSGKVTAVIYDSSGVDRILLSNPDLVKLDEELGNIEIAAVVRLNDTALNDQLNTFIKQYQADGTAAAMVERWINNTGGVMPEIPQPQSPSRKITIITNGLTEPMNYYENGQLTGFDIEFMKRFASFANLEFEIITMDYAAMIPALQSGKGDVIISDFFKTDERGQEVLYTDAYVMLHNSVLVQKSRYAGAVQSSDETAGDGENQTAVTGIFGSLQDSFNKTFIVEDRYQLILQGLWTTVVISLLSAMQRSTARRRALACCTRTLVPGPTIARTFSARACAAQAAALRTWSAMEIRGIMRPPRWRAGSRARRAGARAGPRRRGQSAAARRRRRWRGRRRPTGRTWFVAGRFRTPGRPRR